MKLKFLSIFILSTLVFSGCGNEGATSEDTTVEVQENAVSSITIDSAVDDYNKSIDNLQNLDSYTYSGSTALSVADDDKSGSMEMSSEIKVKKDGDNTLADFTSKFEMADTPEEIKAYYKDGYFYNNNLKRKTDFNNVLAEGNINVIRLTDKLLTAGKDPVIKKVTDGTRIDFDINVAVLQQEAPDFVEKLTSYLRVSEYDFIMGRCQLVAVVGDDGVLQSCSYLIKAKSNIYTGTSEKNFKELQVDCNIEVNIGVSDVNSTDVEFPSDLDGYKEVEETTGSNSIMKTK